MSSPPILIAILIIVVVVVVQMAIFLSCYAKVSPDQVLIISGRRRQLPDGTFVGYRIVKAGGTFVFPVIEKAQVLSLAVMKLSLSQAKARTADGVAVAVDCVAQIKINGDDKSIVSAAEHFLSKTKAETEKALSESLENQLRTRVSDLSREVVLGDTKTFAEKVRASAAVAFAKMGLSIVSFAITDVRSL